MVMASNKKNKIFILSDSLIFREGLKKIIKENFDYFIVDEGKKSETTPERLKNLKVDVLIIDLISKDSNPKESNPYELIKKYKNHYKELKIITFGDFKNSQDIIKVFKVGSSGYLTLFSQVLSFKKCLISITNDEFYIDYKISNEMVTKYIERIKLNSDNINNNENVLTKREEEILKLYVDGKSINEISGILFISPKTVENHKYNLMKKLGFKNDVELVKYAIKAGLTDL